MRAPLLTLLVTIVFSSVAVAAEKCSKDSFREKALALQASSLEQGLPEKPMEAFLASLPGVGSDVTTQLGACDEPNVDPFAQGWREIALCPGYQVSMTGNPIRRVRVVVKAGTNVSCDTSGAKLLTAFVADAPKSQDAGIVVQKFMSLSELVGWLEKEVAEQE